MITEKGLSVKKGLQQEFMVKITNKPQKTDAEML